MGKIYMAKKARVFERFQPDSEVNITNKQCICEAAVYKPLTEIDESKVFL